jgi:hypothetical protein
MIFTLFTPVTDLKYTIRACYAPASPQEEIGYVLRPNRFFTNNGLSSHTYL